MADLKYFNCLMLLVTGDESEKKAAKEYLAEVDPDIWDQEKYRARKPAGFSTALRLPVDIPEICELYHTIRRANTRTNYLQCQYPLLYYN